MKSDREAASPLLAVARSYCSPQSLITISCCQSTLGSGAPCLHTLKVMPVAERRLLRCQAPSQIKTVISLGGHVTDATENYLALLQNPSNWHQCKQSQAYSTAGVISECLFWTWTDSAIQSDRSTNIVIFKMCLYFEIPTTWPAPSPLMCVFFFDTSRWFPWWDELTWTGCHWCCLDLHVNKNIAARRSETQHSDRPIFTSEMLLQYNCQNISEIYGPDFLPYDEMEYIVALNWSGPIELHWIASNHGGLCEVSKRRSIVQTVNIVMALYGQETADVHPDCLQFPLPSYKESGAAYVTET